MDDTLKKIETELKILHSIEEQVKKIPEIEKQVKKIPEIEKQIQRIPKIEEDLVDAKSEISNLKNLNEILIWDVKSLNSKMDNLDEDMSKVKASTLKMEIEQGKKLELLCDDRKTIFEKLDNLGSEILKSNKRIDINNFEDWLRDERLSSLEKKVD